MLNINAYLHFMGKTEEAMNFYKSILGGEFTIFGRFRDVPGGENMNPEDQKRSCISHLQQKMVPLSWRQIHWNQWDSK